MDPAVVDGAPLGESAATSGAPVAAGPAGDAGALQPHRFQRAFRLAPAPVKLPWLSRPPRPARSTPAAVAAVAAAAPRSSVSARCLPAPPPPALALSELSSGPDEVQAAKGEQPSSFGGTARPAPSSRPTSATGNALGSSAAEAGCAARGGQTASAAGNVGAATAPAAALTPVATGAARTRSDPHYHQALPGPPGATLDRAADELAAVDSHARRSAATAATAATRQSRRRRRHRRRHRCHPRSDRGRGLAAATAVPPVPPGPVLHRGRHRYPPPPPLPPDPLVPPGAPKPPASGAAGAGDVCCRTRTCVSVNVAPPAT